MVPRRRAHRAPHPRLHPVERRGHGVPGQPARARRRRAHRHLRLERAASTRSASTTSSAARTTDGSGDQVFIQGHGSPGIYARAFLEGRLTEDQLDGFRQELSHPGGGLPSYPHPRLMPDFWEFPTVSMGLGPLNAIYQARFNRYLANRGIKDVGDSHVWAFLGDGETDEPESLGAIGVAAREELDNLTFVINCNLQRLDGPVRGNGKIIQELESTFRGAGWNVIKVIWGRDWDPLLAARRRRRAGQQDEQHARRPVPDLHRRGRRVHPRELLRRRPAPAQDGRAPDRRRPAQALARRPRLPQGVRGVQAPPASTSASRR